VRFEQFSWKTPPAPRKELRGARGGSWKLENRRKEIASPQSMPLRWFSAGAEELTKGLWVKFVREKWETTMGFGRGALLWLLGVPLPIIILLALFWHH
jgi:hypothetical protein